MRRDNTSSQPATRVPLPKCVAIRRETSPVLKYSAHIAAPMSALGARPRTIATRLMNLISCAGDCRARAAARKTVARMRRVGSSCSSAEGWEGGVRERAQ